ncbi:hypothetical protein NJ76_23235 [Rhodococcus sp. IITR03]|nr:hypothetical protein NJ76_23235 [Rhodococcus sp. IITR03]
MASRNVVASLEARGAAFLAADTDALDALLHADLAYAHSNGVVDSKSELIQKIGSREVKYVEVEVEPELVHEGADHAVIRVRMRARVLVGGSEVELDTQTLEVYLSADSGWQLVALQSTRRS